MPNLSTRRRTFHYCLGQPTNLPLTSLPTEAEVYNYLVYMKHQMQRVNNNFSTSTIPENEILTRVANDVASIWTEKGNLPTISQAGIIHNLKQVKLKAKALLKIPVDRRQKNP